MSAADHTPGPWATSRDAVPAGHVQITVYAEGTGERVATAFGSEANAHLIAAAPDLLSAAKAILFQVDQGKVLERDACITQARDAIAKAEGRS